MTTVPTASLPGVTIHYERAGSGPPLLLIGGTGGDLRRAPSPLAWPGAEHFDQVAYDHRGLGRSIPDDADAQPAMADFAADALALADHLGWERFALIGISFGGMVAQEVAIRAPGAIARLVLACTSSGGAGGASAPLHEILAMGPPQSDARMLELLDVRTGDDEALRARIASLQTPVEVPLAPGLARQLEARRHHDSWDRLPTIEAPTLVAAGRYDGIAPLANSQRIAAQVPAARLEVFEGGHPFLLQDPAAWPAVAAFLA
jgi:3-oxoadipate enol-lactonase